MDQRYLAAVNLLGSFKQNAPVRVVLEDGKPRDMYVSHIFHRADYSFGSPESGRVTVTYGPGRYACALTADMLVLGTASIEARTIEPVNEQEESQETICFCGEAINYEVPGSEGGEFTATGEFAKEHPNYQAGDAVIGHAQCGLDHGLEPA
jgi:hypothetical protein